MDSIFSRIDKMRDAFRAEFDVDAEGSIAEIDRALEAQMEKDPLLMYAGDLFYRASIEMRQKRIALARKLQSDGIAENMSALEYWLWDGRLIDQCRSELRKRPGEKLVQVSGFVLVTNHRSFTRAELKRACRMTVEIDDASFERNFNSDAAVHEVEARAAERERPNPYGRQLNYPGGVRPER
jgi:hypothetical protein